MSNGADHKARKRFGQNFLHDQNIIQKIVAAIHPKPSDCLVEIGPGLGALTTPLLARVDAMEVVELDRDLIPKLPFLPNGEKLTIHAMDALKFNFGELAFANRNADELLRVAGNLPYNISSPLIFHLLSFSGQIKDMHFMLQKEVVERLAAAPNTSNYGRLSVVVQSRCKVEHLFNVSKHCFNPAPKVESAIVRLTPYQEPKFNIKDPVQFEALVKQSFAQRRKTLRNNVKSILSDEQIESCGISPSTRPETLSVEQFALLSNCLS